MGDDTDILDEIVAAWRADTDWEQFGRDVGAILTAHGITPGHRPTGQDHTDGSIEDE